VVDDKPGFSITWLFRFQHRGRQKQPQENGDEPGKFAKLFPWAVVLLLLVEIGILVYIGVLPR